MQTECLSFNAIASAWNRREGSGATGLSPGSSPAVAVSVFLHRCSCLRPCRHPVDDLAKSDAGDFRPVDAKFENGVPYLVDAAAVRTSGAAVRAARYTPSV